MFNTLHEECGVFGIFENKTAHVAQSAYLALFALQHRGQEACGIAVNDDGVFSHYKGDGLVPDVLLLKICRSLAREIWQSVMFAIQQPAVKPK